MHNDWHLTVAQLHALHLQQHDCHVCYASPELLCVFRYASMQGQAGPHTALQLCVTTAVTSGGRALWSGPVQLNALGAAAVVEVPCPVQPVHQHKQKLPGYRLAVTAVQVCVNCARLCCAVKCWLSVVVLCPCHALHCMPCNQAAKPQKNSLTHAGYKQELCHGSSASVKAWLQQSGTTLVELL